jgi:hypothetical protein
VTLGLALVVLSPLSPELPVAFGVVALDALLPKLLARLVPLFGCALVVAPLYEAIEFMFIPSLRVISTSPSSSLPIAQELVGQLEDLSLRVNIAIVPVPVPI